MSHIPPCQEMGPPERQVQTIQGLGVLCMFSIGNIFAPIIRKSGKTSARGGVEREISSTQSESLLDGSLCTLPLFFRLCYSPSAVCPLGQP